MSDAILNPNVQIKTRGAATPLELRVEEGPGLAFACSVAGSHQNRGVQRGLDVLSHRHLPLSIDSKANYWHQHTEGQGGDEADVTLLVFEHFTAPLGRA